MKRRRQKATVNNSLRSKTKPAGPLGNKKRWRPLHPCSSPSSSRRHGAPGAPETLRSVAMVENGHLRLLLLLFPPSSSSASFPSSSFFSFLLLFSSSSSSSFLPFSSSSFIYISSSSSPSSSLFLLLLLLLLFPPSPPLTTCVFTLIVGVSLFPTQSVVLRI